MLLLIDSCPLTRIAGSGKQLIEVMCFLKLVTDQVLIFLLDCRLKQGYYSGGERGITGTCKGKISVRINSRCFFFYFSSSVFLAQCLLECP